MTPRLFLVLPSALPADLLISCAAAACAAGDCASILVPADTAAAAVKALQDLGLAVILDKAEPRKVLHANADGLQLSAIDGFADARRILGNQSLGFVAGTSRHAALEAAELGADYVAFTQTAQLHGEPLIAWWQDVTNVPVVALDAVNAEQANTLLPQKPDFLRPSDAMWTDPASARDEILKLMAVVK